jgi:hypothetical protein
MFYGRETQLIGVRTKTDKKMVLCRGLEEKPKRSKNCRAILGTTSFERCFAQADRPYLNIIQAKSC